MASTTKKPASGRSASKTPKAKTGAGPAIAERSKDAKPTFGKAAPKKVSATAIKAAARTPSKTSPVGRAQGKATVDKADARDDSLGTKVARGAKAAVNVAAGAVVVAAKGAASLASSVKGSKDRPRAK